MPAVLSGVASWVGNGGLAVVFVLMLAESCGIPFPSEVVMPAAGALASTGRLSLAGAILAGALGNLAGSLIAWAAAAAWGRPLLLGPGRWIGIRESHLDIADGWFARHGLLAVFLGRLLPVVRTYISFPAGMARVRLSWFSLLTFLGALPWCAALALAGNALASNYDRVVSGPIEKVALVLAVAVVAVVIVWYVRGRDRPEA